MLTFRQKVLLSLLLVFLVFTVLLYPVVTRLIDEIQKRNLQYQTKRLVQKVEDAPNLQSLLARLQQQTQHLFFRVNLIDVSKGTIYDTHRFVGGEKIEEEVVFELPEVEEALQKGKGYDIRYSALFSQEMAYIAQSFDFQGKKYILRSAFPYGQIEEVSNDFTLAFLFLSVAILLLFSLLAWSIIHYLTRPVQVITDAIKPYQLGQVDHIPEIVLEEGAKDEFGKLAETLNSLSRRIREHIDTLIRERNDREAILESLGEGVIAVDRAMTVIFFNHAAETLLKLKKSDIVGKSFALVRQPKCHELLIGAQSRQEQVSEVLTLEGKPKRYIDAIAVPRGRNEGAILVLQDKTSLHKIIELGRDFIANASHELKTPITIIRGFAETLHDHPELSREISMEITEKIVSNCQRMDTLVRNLLALAAVDEGLPASRLHECDLEDIFLQARQTVLAVHPNAQITIEKKGDEPVHLLADGDLLLQAFLNLLDNAVKYSKPPAQVKVTLEKNEEIIITVADKGIGIPPEHLDRIFERFYAVDKSRSRALGGSGLGLSIVESIVEKHQGKIYVESTAGEGTTFTIIFPIREEEKY